MSAAQASLLSDYQAVIFIGAILLSLLLLLMIRLPAALIIIALIWFLAWTAGAL